MINGAFVLKMKTPSWRLCVVKQAPDQFTSSWMLFGRRQRRGTKETFQMEFGSHQETILIKHLVNLASDDADYAELRLVLVAESPAISCIDSLWSLKGIEMYRNRFYTPTHLHDALHQDVYMLSTSPQIQGNQTQDPAAHSPQHSMQTRSKASRH